MDAKKGGEKEGLKIEERSELAVSLGGGSTLTLYILGFKIRESGY